MAELWRIDELQALAAAGLAATNQDQSPSGRVRDVPDARTIRYYTTLGLLDRPAEMRGRTAYYGRRHVLQLVCIKRLQGQGLPLASVQEQLAGATTRRLASLAGLPPGFWEAQAGAEPDRDSPARRPERTSFWMQPAAEANGVQPAEVKHRPATYVRLPVAPGAALEIAGLDIGRLTSDQAAGLKSLLENLTSELNRLDLAGRNGSPRPATLSDSSIDSSSTSSGESPCC